MHGITDLVDLRRLLAACNQVHEHFRVRGGLEDGAIRFELVAQLTRVGQVPIVGQSKQSTRVVELKWLDVCQ